MCVPVDCGNGEVGPGEQCDGGDMLAQTCESLGYDRVWLAEHHFSRYGLDLENIDDWSAVYEYHQSADMLANVGDYDTFGDALRGYAGPPKPLGDVPTDFYQRSVQADGLAMNQFLYQQQSPLWWRKIERFVTDKVPNKITGE